MPTSQLDKELAKNTSQNNVNTSQDSAKQKFKPNPKLIEALKILIKRHQRDRSYAKFNTYQDLNMIEQDRKNREELFHRLRTATGAIEQDPEMQAFIKAKLKAASEKSNQAQQSKGFKGNGNSLDQILTLEEKRILKMLLLGPWQLNHVTEHYETIKNNGNALLSLDERTRRGNKPDNSNTPPVDGNTDNVFMTFGPGEPDTVRFLDRAEWVIQADYETLMEQGDNALFGLWNSEHLFAFLMERVSEEPKSLIILGTKYSENYCDINRTPLVLKKQAIGTPNSRDVREMQSLQEVQGVFQDVKDSQETKGTRDAQNIQNIQKDFDSKTLSEEDNPIHIVKSCCFERPDGSRVVQNIEKFEEIFIHPRINLALVLKTIEKIRLLGKSAWEQLMQMQQGFKMPPETKQDQEAYAQYLKLLQELLQAFFHPGTSEAHQPAEFSLDQPGVTVTKRKSKNINEFDNSEETNATKLLIERILKGEVKLDKEDLQSFDINRIIGIVGTHWQSINLLGAAILGKQLPLIEELLKRGINLNRYQSILSQASATQSSAIGIRPIELACAITNMDYYQFIIKNMLSAPKPQVQSVPSEATKPTEAAQAVAAAKPAEATQPVVVANPTEATQPLVITNPGETAQSVDTKKLEETIKLLQTTKEDNTAAALAILKLLLGKGSLYKSNPHISQLDYIEHNEFEHILRICDDAKFVLEVLKLIPLRSKDLGLPFAIHLKSQELIEEMLERGADIEARVSNVICSDSPYFKQLPRGCTALIAAVKMNDLKMANCLLEHKADIDAPLYMEDDDSDDDTVAMIVQEEEGYTPLMFAVKQGRSDMVRLLLSKQADVHHQSAKGHTALSLAKETKNNDEILKLLTEQAIQNGDNKPNQKIEKQLINQAQTTAQGYEIRDHQVLMLCILKNNQNERSILLSYDNESELKPVFLDSPSQTLSLFSIKKFNEYLGLVFNIKKLDKHVSWRNLGMCATSNKKENVHYVRALMCAEFDHSASNSILAKVKAGFESIELISETTFHTLAKGMKKGHHGVLYKGFFIPNFDMEYLKAVLQYQNVEDFSKTPAVIDSLQSKFTELCEFRHYFMDCVREGKLEEVKRLEENFSICVNAEVSTLRKFNFDIEQKGDKEKITNAKVETPLIAALDCRQYEMALYLLKLGATFSPIYKFPDILIQNLIKDDQIELYKVYLDALLKDKNKNTYGLSEHANLAVSLSKTQFFNLIAEMLPKLNMDPLNFLGLSIRAASFKLIKTSLPKVTETRRESALLEIINAYRGIQKATQEQDETFVDIVIDLKKYLKLGTNYLACVNVGIEKRNIKLLKEVNLLFNKDLESDPNLANLYLYTIEFQDFQKCFDSDPKVAQEILSSFLDSWGKNYLFNLIVNHTLASQKQIQAKKWNEQFVTEFILPIYEKGAPLLSNMRKAILNNDTKTLSEVLAKGEIDSQVMIFSPNFEYSYQLQFKTPFLFALHHKQYECAKILLTWELQTQPKRDESYFKNALSYTDLNNMIEAGQHELLKLMEKVGFKLQFQSYQLNPLTKLHTEAHAETFMYLLTKIEKVFEPSDFWIQFYDIIRSFNLLLLVKLSPFYKLPDNNFYTLFMSLKEYLKSNKIENEAQFKNLLKMIQHLIPKTMDFKSFDGKQAFSILLTLCETYPHYSQDTMKYILERESNAQGKNTTQESKQQKEQPVEPKPILFSDCSPLATPAASSDQKSSIERETVALEPKHSSTDKPIANENANHGLKK